MQLRRVLVISKKVMLALQEQTTTIMLLFLVDIKATLPGTNKLNE